MQDIRRVALDDRDAWNDALGGRALPSQTWRYAMALQASGLTSALLTVRAGDAVLNLPHLVRGPVAAQSIATLPGLSGASILPSSPAPLLALRALARREGRVAGYLQLAPDTDAAALDAGDELVERTTVFLLDARRWTLRGSTSMIIRRKAVAAAREGAETVEDPVALSAALPSLYGAAQRRHGLRNAFADATIAQWCLDPANVVVGAARAGVIGQVQLWQVERDEAELHLVGSDDAGRALSALVFARALALLAERGIARVNLGAAGERQAGLYRFKTWLGGTPQPSYALHQVYDPAAYQRLCAGAPDSGRFPAYLA